MNKKYNKFHAIIAVIILLAVLVPWHQALAVWYNPATWVDSAVDFGAHIVNATIGQMVITALALVNSIIGAAIGWSAKLLDGFISFQTQSKIYDFPFIRGSWTIIRNFVNLLFILVLIIMAFGTIFSIQKYTWKEMLAPFLIAALLINFSLVIGQYIIGVSNGLSGVFLNMIKEASTKGISDTFAQGAEIVNGVTLSETANKIVSSYIQGMFSVVFLAIFLLAILATAIFALVRIFALWFLLIISPIAWFGYTLPNLRGNTWVKWWDHFLCWCFWLPYFLFFVMFAVIFISSKNTVEMPPGFMSTVGNSIAFYVLSLIFLLGGMSVARKLACASGTGVKMVFGKIETGVRKYAPGAAYVRGGVAGLKERGAEIQEKGLFGIGGERKARIAEAEARGFVKPILKGEFGGGKWGLGKAVGGLREEKEKARAVEIDKEFKKVQALNLNLDELNKRFASAKGIEKYALLKQKAENGWLESTDQQMLLDTFTELGGSGMASGRSLLASLRKGGYERMFAGPKDQENFVKSAELGTYEMQDLKKDLLREMAKSREIYDDLLMRQTVNLFSKDAKDIQDKVMADLQANLSNVYSDLGGALRSTSSVAPPAKLKELIAKEMASKKGKKGINDYATYKAAIDALRGEQTTEGQELIKNLKENSPMVLHESKFRQDLSTFGVAGLPINPAVTGSGFTMNNTERSRLTDKFVDELGKMDFKDIKGLSAEALSAPEMQTALNLWLHMPGRTSVQINELMRGLSEEKRNAIGAALLAPSPAFTYV